MRRLLRFALAVPLVVLGLVAHAQAQVTAIWYQSPNGLLADTQPHLVQASSTVSFTVTSSLTGIGMNEGSTPLQFGFSTHGAPMQVGSLDGAIPPYYSSGPTVGFSPVNGTCGGYFSHIWIREVVPAGDGTLARFAMDFELDCQGGGTLYGEARYNSSVPLSASLPAGWTTPDAITFRTAGPVPAGTMGLSNTAYIYGINAAAPISISNGEYSINGSTFTSSPGTINDHDSVAVRTTVQGGAPYTEASLTIGGLVTPFRALDYSPGDAFTAYTLYNADGAKQTVEAWDAAANVNGIGYATYARVAFGTGYGNVSMDFEPGGSATFAPGLYEPTTEAGHNPATAVMDFTYGSSYCAAAGRYVLLDYAVDGNGTLLRLALDFQLTCFGTQPVFGEIRYNSTVPLARFKPPGTAPDEYRLVAQNPMREGDLAVSNTVSAMGAPSPVAISIVGGEYSVNGGPYTSAAASVQSNDLIKVRARAPIVDGASATATLNLGGLSRDFVLTAYQPGTALSGVYIEGKGLLLAPMNAVTAQSGGITVVTPQGDVTGIAIGSGYTAGQVALNLNCSYTGGTTRTYVREAAYDSNGVPLRFAADFEYNCGTTSPVFGQVRYNSTVPFSELLDTTWRTDTSVPRRVDLDGDGKTDFIIREANGSYTAVLMNGTTAASTASISAPGSDVTILQTGDFDGDGKTDLIVENPDTSVDVWLMDGTTVKSQANLMPAGYGWVVTHVGDFNGDGKTDLVWTNVIDGSVGVWLMNGAAPLQRATMLGPQTGFSPIGVGDFDHDGKSDILWRHRDGTTSIWLMDGLTIRDRGPVMPANTTWRAVKLGDFDGDGYSDILWQNLVDGSVSMWLMNGRTIRDKGNVMPAGGWSPALVGEFNGDGKSDIVWQNVDGSLGIWLMNGRSILSRAPLASSFYSYKPVMLTDTDGNGINEFVFDDLNSMYYGLRQWILNGTTITGNATVPTTMYTNYYAPFTGHDYKH